MRGLVFLGLLAALAPNARAWEWQMASQAPFTAADCATLDTVRGHASAASRQLPNPAIR